MPRVNRRIRMKPPDRVTRSQVLELLLGPNGASAFESEIARQKAWEQARERLSSEFEQQWYAAGNRKNYTDVAAQYCRDVFANRLQACQQVKQACRRHLGDLARIPEESFAFRFDESKADRACRFIELLPHVKGSWASKSERIKLEPWQIFIVCALFGWVKKATDTRRFTAAYVEVSRKNAKSTLAAGIGNYLFACDGEFGAEVYSGATSEKQAFEVFRPALQMLQRSPELAKVLGVVTGAKKMATVEDGSRFEPVVGKPGDGASPHCGVVDEYHEHSSDVLLDTFRTGMGARQQPLLLVITTAGDNLAGPCKLLRDDVARILDGAIERDEVFGLIYTIDPGTEWSADSALEMANPNIGVSVFREFLVTERNAALASARKQGVFKTKHLCVWVGANQAYFNLERWKQLADRALRIEDFLGCPAILSIDLGNKNDLTARVTLFKKVVAGKEHYYVFPRFYIPAAQASKPEHLHYHDWIKSGELIVQPGTSIDFQGVQNDAVEVIDKYRVREFPFDPWNAAQFAQGIAAATKAVPVEIQQSARNLSAPMKELEVLIDDGRIHHPGNPVLTWNIGNVVSHEDANENVFPRKPEGREESKIDGAVALIMAVSRLMAVAPKKSVYATRGIRMLPAFPSGIGAHA